MSQLTVRIMRLPHGADLPLPSYQSAGASGLDLLAAVPADAPLAIAPGRYVAVQTGIAIALPRGLEAQVRPRSGLARNHGVRVLNGPGTVDAIEGTSRSRNVVIEFPDYDAAMACYNSPEYQANIKIRAPHSQADLIIIAGYDGP